MSGTADLKSLAVYAGRGARQPGAIARGWRFLRRHVFDIDAARRRQNERDAATCAARQGGFMSDAFERELAQRLFGSDWGAR